MAKAAERTTWYIAVLLITAVFAALSGAAFSFYVSGQNTARLTELNRQLLHRSEMAVDYAVISLVEAMERGQPIAVPRRAPSFAASSFSAVR